MFIEGNVLQSHPVKSGVPPGSSISLIRFVIHTAGLIKWVELRVQAEGPSFVDDFGWVVSGNNVKLVVEKLEACAAESIEWASRRDIQFDTAKTDAALFTRRRGPEKHLRPKLPESQAKSR